MRAVVVVFPGSNADIEMIHTLRDVVGAVTTVTWHRDVELPMGTDLVAIPGGFSYGDYLRCGAIAKASPILAAIKGHAERGGFVLGVCNGFQILTEVGLLPGALTRNAHMRFECRDVFVTSQGNGGYGAGQAGPAPPRPPSDGPMTHNLPPVLRLPIAHAEGRYQADPKTLAKLRDRGDVALRYCDATGAITPEANPNGSADNIAGIYGGPKRNVIGLMPHPERASEPILGNADGKRLFEAIMTSVIGDVS